MELGMAYTNPSIILRNLSNVQFTNLCVVTATREGGKAGSLMNPQPSSCSRSLAHAHGANASTYCDPSQWSVGTGSGGGGGKLQRPAGEGAGGGRQR